MAVGDSITQGGKSFRCYREFLVPSLSKSAQQIRFVGPNQDSTSAHCGYGGRDARILNGVIEDVYTEHQPGIVLIHAGHNCFSKDKPVPGIIKATAQMIDTIHSLNPDVTVLLAQVILSYPKTVDSESPYVMINSQLAEGFRSRWNAGYPAAW